jgi:hypothetical protein
MVMTIVSGGAGTEGAESERSTKEAIALVGVIGRLSRELTPANLHMLQVHGWLMKVATETDIGELFIQSYHANIAAA